jgi:predicted amidohydrolase YtcJ
VAGSTAGDWDHRHQLAHLDLVDPADARRMAELGVIANVQPLWARQDPVLVETKLPYLSPEQQQRHFPFGSLHGLGVPLAMGSDWPVSSPDPLWGLHTAVTRTAPRDDPHAQDERSQHDPLLPGEAVDVRTALAAYTSVAARANRREDHTGSIRLGYAADLVVLDRDPVSVPAEELSTLRVRSTFVDGRVVHTT